MIAVFRLRLLLIISLVLISLSGLLSIYITSQLKQGIEHTNESLIEKIRLVNDIRSNIYLISINLLRHELSVSPMELTLHEIEIVRLNKEIKTKLNYLEKLDHSENSLSILKTELNIYNEYTPELERVLYIRSVKENKGLEKFIKLTNSRHLFTEQVDKHIALLIIENSRLIDDLEFYVLITMINVWALILIAFNLLIIVHRTLLRRRIV